MKLDVYSSAGQKTGRSVELDDEVFGIEPNDHVIYLDVKLHLNNRRQGTSKTKQRNEIAGSTRKLHKQKGTGGSRKGDIKNPLYHGGGRIFGPQPREYNSKLNVKVKQLARKSAFAYKAKADNIIILEDFNYTQPKTRQYLDLLKALEISSLKTLVLLQGHDENVYKSIRNLSSAEVCEAEHSNTYNVMHADKLIITEAAIAQLNAILK